MNPLCLRLLDGQHRCVLNFLVVYQAVVHYTLLSYVELDQAERSTYSEIGRVSDSSC